MRHPLRKILAASGAAFLVLLSVVLVRALTATSRQPEPVPLSGVSVPGDAAVAHLAEAIRFPTVSHTDREGIDPEPFRAFASWLRETYPRADAALRRETVNGHSLLYTWPGRDPSLPAVLLAAHYDVVPVEPGAEGQWSHPPFAGVVEGGTVWGRGSLDDKASVVGIMEAVEALLARGFEPRRTIYLAFGHDEEIGGRQGAGRMAELLAMRGARLAWVLDEGSAILEDLLPVEGRVAGIGIAEKGFVSLELAAVGEGGHASMPPELTAAGRVARAVDRVQSAPFPARLAGPSRATLAYLAPEMDLAGRLVMTNLWLFEPLVLDRFQRSTSTNAAVRTTIAPTMLAGSSKDNILPERASAVINFRLLQGDTLEGVRERVIELVDDERVTVSLHGEFGSEPSPISSLESDAFRGIASIARSLGRDIVVAPMQVVGATDSRHYLSLAENLYRFLPVTLDPASIESVHGTDERIRVEDFLGMIRFYATLIEQSPGSGPESG